MKPTISLPFGANSDATHNLVFDRSLSLHMLQAFARCLLLI